MKIKKIGILTSGGDSSSMNKVLSTFVKHCLMNDIEPYFIYNGFEGLYKGEIEKATLENINNIWNRPGTLIKSSRFPEFKDEKIRNVAKLNLEKFKIDCLFVCGGNGSYIGAEKLTDIGVKIIGLPGTIDNDIASSEFTIGFDTSLNSVKDDIAKIRSTMESHNFIAFVEIMGRDCLDLTLMSGIATEADYIITNENILSKEEILNLIKKIRLKNKGSILILVSELIYGQNKLPTFKEISDYVYSNINEKIRVNILGYTQRGNIPTAFDLILATRLTIYAIDLTLNGVYNVAVGNKGDTLIKTPIKEANEMLNPNRIKEIELVNKGN